MAGTSHGNSGILASILIVECRGGCASLAFLQVSVSSLLGEVISSSYVSVINNTQVAKVEDAF